MESDEWGVESRNPQAHGTTPSSFPTLVIGNPSPHSGQWSVVSNPHAHGTNEWRVTSGEW